MELIDTIESCLNDLLPFIERIENKDIVLYLGLTKSGKSTLINYLIGTRLQCKCIQGKNKIAKVNDCDPGPVIGEGSTSSTKKPQLYPYNNLFIMDTPGFFDNRKNQEVINAFFLKSVHHANTCKFVLVVDTCTITSDNVEQFLKSLNSLVSLVESDVSGSLSLVCTKPDSDDNLDSIIDRLRDIIEQDELDITLQVRNLLRSIVQQRESISFFRKPTQEGRIVNVKLLEGHDEAVRASQPLNVKEVKFNVSISSDMLLKVSELFSAYCDVINFSTLSDFHISFNKYLKVEKYVYASTDKELDHVEKLTASFSVKLMEQQGTWFETIEDIETSFRNFLSPHTKCDFFRELKVFTEFESLKVVKVVGKKYYACLTTWQKDISTLMERINNEKMYRRDRDLKIEIEDVTDNDFAMNMGGAGLQWAATEAIGAILRSVALAAIPVVGTTIAVGGRIAAAASAGVSFMRAVDKHQEIDNRMKERKRQGRPVPAKYLND